MIIYHQDSENLNIWGLNKMFKIEISQDAKKYILDRSDSVTVDLVMVSG